MKPFYYSASFVDMHPKKAKIDILIKMTHKLPRVKEDTSEHAMGDTLIHWFKHIGDQMGGGHVKQILGPNKRGRNKE